MNQKTPGVTPGGFLTIYSTFSNFRPQVLKSDSGKLSTFVLSAFFYVSIPYYT